MINTEDSDAQTLSSRKGNVVGRRRVHASRSVARDLSLRSSPRWGMALRASRGSAARRASPFGRALPIVTESQRFRDKLPPYEVTYAAPLLPIRFALAVLRVREAGGCGDGAVAASGGDV